MAITRTVVSYVEGQSPIVLHDVPQSVELVGDITWKDEEQTIIDDFAVKIKTKDEYSTGVPHKVIKRVDTLNTTTKTWTEGTQETYEAQEKEFTLNYKGHERDFEVKVVEGEGGESLPTPIVVSHEDGTFYFYEIEPLKDEWKDASDHAFYPLVDVALDFYTGVDFKALLEGASLEVPSEIQDDAWYTFCIDGDIPRDILTNKNIQFTSEGNPIEGSRLTFVSSGSGSSLYIRYRWGMNDAHDLTIGGGGASVETLPLGGKIFYIDSSDNGATYHFYKEDGSEIEGWTDVASLTDAVSYSVEGEPTTDKVYVYYPTKYDSLLWGYYGTSIGAKGTAIGTGKTNTATVMSRTDIPSNSIWSKLSEIRTSSGIDDWFVPSKYEADKFREADLEPWGRKSGGSMLWPSSELSVNVAWYWNCDSQAWYNRSKDYGQSVFFTRAF